MTIAKALQWSKHTLQVHKVSDDGQTDSSGIDSKILLAASLECEHTYLHTWPDRQLSDTQQIRFEQYIQRRCTGAPVAYIIGYRDFWSLTLKVSPATLIPRADTECLVEHALALSLKPNAKVLDLGTGTGAIALACASEKPSWHIIGVDKNHEAVQLAKQNAQLNQLSHVKFMQSDWFSSLPPQRFNLIVTNPPYVEYNSHYLSLGDVRFEPASALTSGTDGLDDIKHIAAHAKSYLANGAWLVIEHGYQQGEDVARILESNGYHSVLTKSDMNNLPRITLAQL